MTLFQNVTRKGWLTLALGVVGGLAASLIAGEKLLRGRDIQDEIVEEEVPPDEISQDEVPANEDTQDGITREKRGGGVSMVRRASYLAFEGCGFRLYTGGYHCSLESFDTQYLLYRDRGTTERGIQWFEFKAKDGAGTDNAEIRFSLTGSCYETLVYQVIIARLEEPSVPENNNLEE